MKTLNEQWKQYRDACYPQGLSATQSMECHQAFMAGALAAMLSVQEASALPEPADLAAVGKLTGEVQEFARHQCARMRARN